MTRSYRRARAVAAALSSLAVASFLMGSSSPSHDTLERQRDENADRIGHEVARVEAIAENQMAECRATYRIEARRMVQLTQLDGDTDAERHGRSTP